MHTAAVFVNLSLLCALARMLNPAFEPCPGLHCLQILRDLAVKYKVIRLLLRPLQLALRALRPLQLA